MEEPFELESYEDPSLPSGVFLESIDDLAGHTIKVVCDYPGGEFANSNEIVFVTETRCWTVLRPEAGYTCEDGADIVIPSRYGKDPRVLSDYLDADQLRKFSLVNLGEYQLLKAKEQEREAAQKKIKADRLRADLAKLES